MAVCTLELTADSITRIARHERLAGDADDMFYSGLGTATAAGAEEIRTGLVLGHFGVRIQNPATGLAASVSGWMLSDKPPLGAVGVPTNTPAYSYARILNEGGVIRPKRAKALAVPVSEEAKQHTSPRQMNDLVMISRKGKPPLLVRQTPGRGKDYSGARLQVHWVLLACVTIPAFRWLSRGVDSARPAMSDAFSDRVNQWIDEYEK